MKLSQLVVLVLTAAVLLGSLSCSPYPAASTGPTPTATPQATPPATATPVPATPQATPTAAPATPQATAAAGDTTPPAFIWVKIENGFWDVPIVFWMTNEPTTGRIEYGSNRFELMSGWSEGLTTSNGVSMPLEGGGLIVMTNYFLRVRIKDAAGNETLSREMIIPYQELDNITFTY